jgi:hypothetical protein
MRHVWLAAIFALSLALPALAHDIAKGPHGGRVADAGDYHVELVTKGTRVDVFVTDAGDKPVAAAGFKGVAILLVNGKSQRIPLTAEAGTRLVGSAGATLPAEPKGAVQITAPDGKTTQARFN